MRNQSATARARGASGWCAEGWPYHTATGNTNNQRVAAQAGAKATSILTLATNTHFLERGARECGWADHTACGEAIRAEATIVAMK